MPLQLDQLARYLEGKARAKKPVTYREVVDHFELEPLTEAWTTHSLAGAFEQLDQQDANADRPFRTAMVYSKERSMPGPGFFHSLETRKGIVALNDDRRLEVYTHEYKATIAYNWPS